MDFSKATITINPDPDSALLKTTHDNLHWAESPTALKPQKPKTPNIVSGLALT